MQPLESCSGLGPRTWAVTKIAGFEGGWHNAKSARPSPVWNSGQTAVVSYVSQPSSRSTRRTMPCEIACSFGNWLSCNADAIPASVVSSDITVATYDRRMILISRLDPAGSSYLPAPRSRGPARRCKQYRHQLFGQAAAEPHCRSRLGTRAGRIQPWKRQSIIWSITVWTKCGRWARPASSAKWRWRCWGPTYTAWGGSCCKRTAKPPSVTWRPEAVPGHSARSRVTARQGLLCLVGQGNC